VGTARVDPERISVIFHGVDLARFSPLAATLDAQAVIGRLDLKPPYFLFISRIEHPGKNHVRLIRAFADFKARTGFPHSLVLAGADWDRAEFVHKTASECAARDSIRFTGFVANEDLLGLYGGAEALFFPSLFEGFGMPILEAMAAGLPVFCSDRSSLPEVGGDAAVYFNPEDEADIARKLEMAASDRNLLGSLRARGLSRTENAGWEQTARRTLELILETARGGGK
jgi:glycosyltransferase involved in cell wall biosynthesis